MRTFVSLGVAGVVAALVGCTPAAPAPATAPPAATSAAAKPAAAVSPAASAVAPGAPSPTAAASPAVAAASPVAVAVGPSGERLIEQSAETRFQLDLSVPDAALASYLPTGWSSNVATTGAAKDANLRAVFIDRVTVNGPTGAPLGTGSNRLVYLVAPVRDAGRATVQLVMGGLTEDAADVPGPFGNYLRATTHTMQRSTSADDGRSWTSRTGSLKLPQASTWSCT